MKWLTRVWRGFLCVGGCVVVLVGLIVTYRLVVVERLTELQRFPVEHALFTTAAGDEISYRVWPGQDAETVILVGGLAAWSGTWESTVLEQRARGNQDTFVAIDLPPFGFSRVASTDYSRVAQAERILAVVREVATATPVIIVGHSYGGGPVAEAVLTNPALFKHQILISPVLAMGATEVGSAPALLASRAVRTAGAAVVLSIEPLLLSRLRSFVYVQDHISYELLRMYTYPLRTDGRSARLGDWLHAYMVDALPQYRSTQALAWSTSAVPVTLIWGEQDTLTPVSLAEEVTVVRPDAEVRRLSQIGHIPMIEDRAVFNDVLAQALAAYD